MKQILSGVLLVAGLAGCASQETLFRPQLPAAAQEDSAFTTSGRLSIKIDGKGQVANFEWSHAPARDELAVNTPIGTTVARLVRDSQGVSLEADGKTWRAPDVEALTAMRLGWTLPLDNLVWWIRGRAAPGVPLAFAADGSLLQQGWQIHFTSEAGSTSPYPKRVDLVRDNLNIRLVTYRWQ
jgi:outer membrane lipoprotein LolB